MEFRLIDVKGIDYGRDTQQEIRNSKVGSDIQLTIDYELQLKIEDLLKNQNGSIICMNPENGEVLAMASSPDYSLKEFIGPLKQELWDQWKEDNRLLNRATMGKYEPGSLYKLVAFVMFMEERKIPIDAKVFCNGKYELEDQSNPGKPQIYRCWKKEGHGEVDLHDAIMKSCNVYFYDMILKYQEKDKYIINVLHKYAEELGFNEKTGIEIVEKKGRIPDSDWMVRNNGKRWPKRGSMPNLIIGQGANAITPLQAINSINLIAMDGATFQPKLILDNPSVPFNSSIDQYVWVKLKEAMYSVVNDEGGTGISLKNNDFIIRGKTGTAQTTSSSIENLISWFGGYIEYDDNLMSLLVMVENTNSDTKSIAKILSKELINFQLSRGEK
jgi:penicillin-binding protein 2